MWLAFSATLPLWPTAMGASKTTVNCVQKLVPYGRLAALIAGDECVVPLRAFNSSMGQYIGNGGALSTGQGSIFLWLFCALAFLKTAQKFDSYLASMGLNVAQTGSSMGMELLMAARVLSGVGGGVKSAGSVFGGGSKRLLPAPERRPKRICCRVCQQVQGQ